MIAGEESTATALNSADETRWQLDQQVGRVGSEDSRDKCQGEETDIATHWVPLPLLIAAVCSVEDIDAPTSLFVLILLREQRASEGECC